MNKTLDIPSCQQTPFLCSGHTHLTICHSPRDSASCPTTQTHTEEQRGLPGSPATQPPQLGSGITPSLSRAEPAALRVSGFAESPLPTSPTTTTLVPGPQRPQPGAADGTDGQVTNKPLYLLGTKEQDVHIWPFEFPYAQKHPHRRHIFTSVNLEPQYKENFFKLKVWGRGTQKTHGKQPYFTTYLFKRCLREQLQSVHAINPKEATRPCHPSQPGLLI